jgi:hypothetical protein
MKLCKYTKVFFDPGYLSIDNVANLTGSHECLKLIRHRKKDLQSYQSHNLDIHIYPDYKNERFSGRLVNDIQKVWSAIIDDHQTSVLFDRTENNGSEVFKFNELFLMCYAYQKWLEQEKPEIILFTVTPHNIKTWVLSKVAESIGIPVLFFQVSFFPWRQFLMEGLRKNARIISPVNKEPTEKDRQFYAEYIRKKKGTLEDAMPGYEINRLKRNNWKLLNVESEFKNFLKKPLRSIEKIKSYTTYEKLSKEVENIKYVAFFLHFQPERTTIPEGYGFGIQLSAILALQQSLPDDAYLVVREHPSTYTLDFSNNYRNTGFYKLVSSIDRVIISSLTADPYKIIDNSIAVASITGTVIGEALVRGKPGIAFGAGPMQVIDSPCFHRYQSIENLRKFLSNLDKLDAYKSEEYFESVCSSTYSGIAQDNTEYDEGSRPGYLSVSVMNGISELLAGDVSVG